jgi:hypothetical protein
MLLHSKKHIGFRLCQLKLGQALSLGRSQKCRLTAGFVRPGWLYASVHPLTRIEAIRRKLNLR